MVPLVLEVVNHIEGKALFSDMTIENLSSGSEGDKELWVFIFPIQMRT